MLSDEKFAAIGKEVKACEEESNSEYISSGIGGNG
jgi:hypothetical protein